MKISELIASLNEKMTQHGDVQVAAFVSYEAHQCSGAAPLVSPVWISYDKQADLLELDDGVLFINIHADMEMLSSQYEGRDISIHFASESKPSVC